MPRTDIFLRNFPILSSSLQKKIGTKTLLFVGCGLGSNIAILAARVGFKRFILADGDNVERTNLNRQEFTIVDISKNKARVLSAKLKAISPTVRVEVINKFLVNKEIIESLVKRSDIVINTADFRRGFFDVLRQAKKHSKWVICPFNVGFGSSVIVFNKKNSSLIDKLDSGNLKENEFFVQLLKKSKGYSVPKYFLPIYKKILSGKSIPYTPQIAPASFTTASLAISLSLSIVSGSTIKMFPRVNSVDLMHV